MAAEGKQSKFKDHKEMTNDHSEMENNHTFILKVHIICLGAQTKSPPHLWLWLALSLFGFSFKCLHRIGFSRNTSAYWKASFQKV